MTKKIMMLLCALLLAMPGLNFAEEKTGPNPNESAYEHASENAKFEREGELFNKKAYKKLRAKRLADKEAAEAKNKAEETQAKREGRGRGKEAEPGELASEHAEDKAKFQRTGEVFDNKANKKIRAKRLAEKKAAEAAGIKKKAEKDQDKGEGQVKVKF